MPAPDLPRLLHETAQLAEATGQAIAKALADATAPDALRRRAGLDAIVVALQAHDRIAQRCRELARMAQVPAAHDRPTTLDELNGERRRPAGADIELF